MQDKHDKLEAAFQRREMIEHANISFMFPQNNLECLETIR